MILLVFRDAFLGIRLRGPARVSFMLGAAQVSLERVVTFFLHKIQFFLILEDLRAIHYLT